MFNNIGHKIQVLAKVLCWIGIICWVITGLALMAGGSSMTYRLNGEFVRANSGAGVVAGIHHRRCAGLVDWLVPALRLWSAGGGHPRDSRKHGKQERRIKKEPESSLFSRGNGFLFFALISASPCG